MGAYSSASSREKIESRIRKDIIRRAEIQMQGEATTSTHAEQMVYLPINMLKLAFKHIEGVYYRGKYGNLKVIVDTTNGFVNATRLCLLANKNFEDWRITSQARELIDLVAARSGNDENELLILHPHGAATSGVYVCAELLPSIAGWASAEFALDYLDVANEIARDTADDTRRDRIAKHEKKIKQLKDTLIFTK